MIRMILDYVAWRRYDRRMTQIAIEDHKRFLDGDNNTIFNVGEIGDEGDISPEDMAAFDAHMRERHLQIMREEYEKSLRFRLWRMFRGLSGPRTGSAVGRDKP